MGCSVVEVQGGISVRNQFRVKGCGEWFFGRGHPFLEVHMSLPL